MINKLRIWPILVVVTIFLISLIIYLLVENYLLLKILILVICLEYIWLLIVKQQFSGILFLAIYLSSVCIYHYLSYSSISLWLVIVLLLLMIGGLSYILVDQIMPSGHSKIFYSLLVYLATLEVFLVIMPWPIIAQFKGIIILITSYTFWELLDLSVTKELIWPKIWPYIATFIFIITLIITTSSWVGY